MAFLELSNLTKSYGDSEVLHNINLSVEQGEFVAIVGYSGAGKSTLMSLIAGLVKPDAGTVMLNGSAVKSPGPDRAIVFQNYSLLPWLTVFENVYLAVDQVFPKWTKQQKQEHTDRHVAMVNLAHARDKRPDELSGGMRQRVSVARALAIDPAVLLLDEPLGALDALTRATLQDEIVRIWEGVGTEKEADDTRSVPATLRKTVILITNDVDEGILLADRIIPLSAGPAATLGPSIPVTLARPRDRKAMNHDPAFKAIRQQVFEWLLGEGSPARRAIRKPVRRGVTERPSITVGFLPLTDAAPLVVGVEREVFHKHGIDVKLQKFPSWDAITDAVCSGKIEAAHIPASIPVAIAAGLMGRKRSPLIVPWLMNRNGQGITLAGDLKRVGGDLSKLKKAADAARIAGQPLTFAGTHRFGTHELWLRYWLAAGGIDPDADVNVTVTPPPLMLAGLRQGEISGFCVGEPWNAKAVAEGLGFTSVASQDIWSDHPEKALAFGEGFAADNADIVRKCVIAVHEASQWIDDPQNKTETAHLLSKREYCNVREEELLPRLKGQYDFGDGRTRNYAVHPIRFCGPRVNCPQAKYAIWFLTQFRRWGHLPEAPDHATIAERVFRHDLYGQIAAAGRFEASAVSDAPETLFDGKVFDPKSPEEYVASFGVGSALADAMT